jgi:hypothetical protein
MPAFFIQRPSKIHPTWNFWYTSVPSGNPVRGTRSQGDQVGRIFAFGAFFENYVRSTNIGELFLTRSGLGYILGDFFTISSGHPALSRKRTAVAEAKRAVVSTSFF